MAYRLEQEENGQTALVISGWQDGIAPDPYSGLQKVLSANIDVPREVASGYSLSINTLGTGTFGKPIHKAIKQSNGVASAYFILDATGQVWSSATYNGTWSYLSTSNTTTGATATNGGLVYWIPPSGGSGWLFKFRNNAIDYLAGGAGTWVSGWDPSTGGSGGTATTASVNHFALAGQDGAVYFCNGAFVGSIIENAGEVFDPTDTSTYTFNAEALAIPPYDKAQSLAEQGVDLLVGGSLNAIYPWDRVSPSFRYPIFIGDTFIDRMVTVNTNVYIFPGGTMSRGRIYLTNGSQANLFYKIPDHISGIQDPYFVWGDVMFHRNQLIFGFFMKQNNTSGFVTADTSFGTTAQVWAIDLNTGVFRGISRINAGDGIGNCNVIMPTLQTSGGMSYIVGIEEAQGAYSIQYSATPSGTSGGDGRFNIFTDLIPVGTFLQKKTYSQIEFKLRSPLQSGESISVLPVVDGVNGTAYTTNTTGVLSDLYQVNFQKAQWLYFIIQGTGNSPTSGLRLEEIRLR